MEKITRRTLACLFISLLLTLGVGLFVFRFFSEGGHWVSFAANDHIYEDGVLESGTVTDRRGNLLAQAEYGDWTYSDDYSVRVATLHAVGDAEGRIGTGAITAFADKLSGYNMITGTRTLFGGERRLYMTLDAELCARAYESMQGLKGCIGLYNYKNGEMLCMVSADSYDPYYPPEIAEGDESYDGIYINRFLSSTFIPGSTMKIVTCAAAYDTIDGILQRDFYCDGSVDFDGHEVTCPYEHGDLILQSALTSSCNGVFGSLAVEMGPEVMRSYAEKCGLTASYSIDGIKTRASTFDFDTEDGFLAWSGVGQGFDQVNPCSMMILCGAVANGGRSAVPHLIHKITTGDGLRVSLYYNHSTDRLLQTETAAYLRQAMLDNVTYGYGDYYFPDLNVGAKTGTAQSDNSSENNAWFVGFCADEEHPYAFTVYLEGGGAGSGMALDVASSLLATALELGY